MPLTAAGSGGALRPMTSSGSLSKLSKVGGVDGGMTSKDILATWVLRYMGPDAPYNPYHPGAVQNQHG